MKLFKPISSKGPLGRIAAAILLMLSLGVAPALVQASVSGKATIYNQATVTYTSGLATLTASDDVTVAVTTLPAGPTFTLDTTTNAAAQTVDSGVAAVYDYVLTSNANGIDAYSLSDSTVDANVGVPGNVVAPASLTLWGGIVVDIPADNTIDLPGGSVGADLTAGAIGVGSVVVLDIAGTDRTYTVFSITPGVVQSTVPSNEVYDRIVLTPMEAVDATGADVTAGDQIGEQGTFTLTQTAGTPTTAGTDGTHTNSITGSTTATDETGAGGVVVNYNSGALTVTTVNSPAVTILKESRNITAGDVAFVAGGTTAKPGEVIEYRITITGDPAAAVTNVYLTDVIPDYTSINTGDYGAGDMSVTYTDVLPAEAPVVGVEEPTIINDGDNGEVDTGTLYVTVGGGAGDADPVGPPVGGQISAGDSVEVLFRVTVNP